MIRIRINFPSFPTVITSSMILLMSWVARKLVVVLRNPWTDPHGYGSSRDGSVDDEYDFTVVSSLSERGFSYLILPDPQLLDWTGGWEIRRMIDLSPCSSFAPSSLSPLISLDFLSLESTLTATSNTIAGRRRRSRSAT